MMEEIPEEPRQPQAPQGEERETIQEMPVQQSEQQTRWELDLTPEIRAIINRMRGRVFDEKQEEWVQVREPLVNEKGIHKIMVLMEGMTTKATPMTDLRSDEVVNVVRTLHCDLAWHLIMKMEEYEIDKPDLRIIIPLVTNMIFFSVKRSEEGGERKYRKGIMRVSESTKPAKEEKSIWSKVIPLK